VFLPKKLVSVPPCGGFRCPVSIIPFEPIAEMRWKHPLRTSHSPKSIEMERCSRYRATLQREYNMIIAENVGKMDVLERSFGKFSFSRQDSLCAFARAHGMKMEAGPLVWAHAVPSWLNDRRFSADRPPNSGHGGCFFVNHFPRDYDSRTGDV
jgi:hypothetical protein